MARLPSLACTRIRVGDGEAGGEAIAGNNKDRRDDDAGLEVRLLHVQDPAGGVFSQKKGQCDLWEFVWGSSILFSRLLCRLRPAFAVGPCDVLEVGCGSGLCSLTCGISGAKRVVATDAVEDAVRVVRKSYEQNMNSMPRHVVMEFARATWERPETYEESGFDIVIGSDVLFARWTAAPLSRAVARAMKRGGIALIADPVRLNVDEFVDRLEAAGLTAHVRRFRAEDEQRAVREVGNLSDARSTFVKLKCAKLVVAHWKGEGDALSPVATAALAIVLQQTEPFDDAAN